MRVLTHMTRTVAAALIALALACVVAALPARTAHAANPEPAGTVSVAVVNQAGTGYIVAPTSVPYTQGQTLRQALEASGLGFEFTGDSFVVSIGGVAPDIGFVVYYAGHDGYIWDGGYDSTRGYALPASEVEGVFFSANTQTQLSEPFARLVHEMCLYQDSTNGYKNHPAAKAAYNQARRDLPGGVAATVESDWAALRDARLAYEEHLAGTTYPVTFNPKIGSSSTALTGFTVTCTDSYGVATTVESTSSSATVELLADDYTYEVSTPDGTRAARGSVSVAAGSSGTSVTCTLPARSVNWFGSVQLFEKVGNDILFFDATGAPASNDLVVSVPDYCTRQNSVYALIKGSSTINGSGSYSQYSAYAVYNRVDTGEPYTNKLSFESQQHILTNLVEPGTAGSQVAFEICGPADSAGVVQVERTYAQVVRTPSLAGLSVTDNGAETLSGFVRSTHEYDIETVSDELVVTPQLFGSADDGYTVSIDGQQAESGTGSTVDITAAAQDVVIELGLDNGQTTTYTLHVAKRDAATVTFTHAAGVAMSVVNAAGGTVAPEQVAATSTTYRLIDGASYTYVGTVEQRYHVSKAFTATDGASFSVSTPTTQTWIDGLVLAPDTFPASNPKYNPFEVDESASDAHTATFFVPDTQTVTWLRIIKGAALSGTPTYTLTWDRASHDGSSTTTGKPAASGSPYSTSGEIDPANECHVSLSRLVVVGGYGNSATLTVTSPTLTSRGETSYQDYTIGVRRCLSIASLSASNAYGSVLMTQTATLNDPKPVTKFESGVTDYTIDVSQADTSIDVQFSFKETTSATPQVAGAYTATIAGQTFAYEPLSRFTATVPLDTSAPSEVIPLALDHDDMSAVDTVYYIRVRKHPPVSVSLNATPSDATVMVIDNSTGGRVWPASDGTYSLVDGFDYTYNVAKKGYVGQRDTFTAQDGQVVSVTLEAALPNPSIDPTITAEWPYFRADSDNNSVVSAATPRTANEGVLYWATKLGQGYDSGAAGCPILADGYLYSYGGNKIYKVDTVTGETVAENTMVGSSSFAITPMTYADGMVFCALSDGRVEAFDAKTLESLWVYKDPLGGQPNCPITYCNGYLYTGFWVGYTSKANFVCLSVDDEHPDVAGHGIVIVNGRETVAITDAKQAQWTHTSAGGFYWAGAWACEDFVLMGGDDGYNDNVGIYGPGVVYSFDPVTGAVIDKLEGAFEGDVRTTITYAEGWWYFMTKTGWLCRVQVNDDGTFNRDSFQKLQMSNGSTGMTNCTTTVTVHNGRAYVGAMGAGAYTGYTGHAIVVVDLNAWEIAYLVHTQGYPQATGLLTTAYEGQDSDGWSYVYFIENVTPGKIRVIKDRPGQTEPEEVVTETYRETNTGLIKTAEVAPVLFSPDGAHAQYAICSPVCDEYGIIYFKNDSAHMMAVGPTVQKIEVTKQPDRTVYSVGETFDPTGMEVTLTYSNGLTRDVTDYVAFDTEPLELDDDIVPITFPHTLYQNDHERTPADPVLPYNCPSTFVTVEVGEAVAPAITTTELPDAETGKAYSTTLAASGAPARYTWALAAGTLPQGLSLNTSTGVISGTPAAGTGGEYPITVTATNTAGTGAPRELTLTVLQAPAITSPTTLSPAAAVGEAYANALAATGFPAPTWSIDGQIETTLPDGYTLGLPAGIELDAQTGALSGTPTVSGQYMFAAHATNGVGVGAAKRHVLNVVGVPTVLTTQLDPVEVDQVCAITLKATACPAVSSWSLAGDLPQGLSFNAAAGTISGTPTQTGTYPLTVTATNSVGESAAVQLELVVGAAPQITTTALPQVKRGASYSTVVEATGHPAPVFQISAGELPAGLALDAGTGAITGTPTVCGAFNLTFTASNGIGEPAVQELVLEVLGDVAITTDELDHAVVGQPYSFAIEAEGNPAPTLAVTVGSLPAGLSLAADGTITGTPEAAGSSTFTVTATSPDEGVPTHSREFTLTVAQLPQIATTSLPDALLDQAYSQTVEGTAAPETVWSLPAGSNLPVGLELDSASGTVAGIPTQTGDYTFAVQLSDGFEDDAPTVQQVTMRVVQPATIATSTLPNATRNAAYSASLVANGYPNDRTWSLVDGALPAGLVLNTRTGLVSGTPTAPGSYAFTVSVANGVGEPDVREFTIVVEGPTGFVTASPLSGAVAGEPYSVKVEAGGCPQPTIELASGSSLPAGLALASDGTISGTPTQSGSFSFTLVARCAGQSVSKAYGLTVGEAPAVTTESLPNGKPGQAYTAQLEATGYPAPTFSLADGAVLPDGLTLADDGAISGTPTGYGVFDVAFAASNGVGEPAVKTLRLVVGELPVITTTSLPAAALGGEYTATIDATGDPAPTFMLAEGSSLPEGFSLAQDGSITGTPSAVGQATVTVVATNVLGQSAPVELTLHVVDVDKSGLETAVAQARELIKSVPAAQDGSGVSPRDQWVPQAAADTFEAAIHAAETVLADPQATAEQVDAAVAALGEAATAFESAKQPGTAKVWLRLWGQTALQTTQAVVQEGWQPGDTDYVIVATMSGYHDALAAAPLAGAYNAPIILTRKVELSPAAAEEIQRLGVRHAIVVGGPAAVSEAVDPQIEALGVSVERCYGDNAQLTAIAIADRAAQVSGGSTACIVATSKGYQDALAIAPYAYAYGVPIYLTNSKGQLRDEVATEVGGCSRAIIVGGEAAVPRATEDQIRAMCPSVERLAGDNALITADTIAQWCVDEVGMSPNGMGVATAGGYHDALAGAALCGRSNSVLVLVNKSGTNLYGVEHFVRGNADSISRGYVFGGEAAVKPGVLDALEAETS